MTCIPAPACKAMLAEATRLWPKRSRASDGICPSADHTRRSPSSDHEKGNAADLTDDPNNGCAAHVLGEQIRLRRDIRVKYMISRGRICSSLPIAGYAAWAWRPYSGSNPHDKHLHVSIHHSARDDVSPWFDTTPEEVKDMHESHRFVEINPAKTDTSNRFAFYSWDPADSSIYAWNGAPGPVLTAQGQQKARQAGGIRHLFHVQDKGLVAVVGNPGEQSSWTTWAFWTLGEGDGT